MIGSAWSFATNMLALVLGWLRSDEFEIFNLQFAIYSSHAAVRCFFVLD